MTTLYLTQPYSTVRKEGETLIVKTPENKETGTPASSTRVPMMKVDQVVVMGDSTVTTPALAGAAGAERRHLFLRLLWAFQRTVGAVCQQERLRARRPVSGS